MSSQPIDNKSTVEKPITIKTMIDHNTDRHILVKSTFNEASRKIDTLFRITR